MSLSGWAAIGAALALAFHSRQTAVFFAIVPLAVVAGLVSSLRPKLAVLAALALGGLLAWAALLAALTPIMSLPGYVQTVFRAPPRYRGHYWLVIVLLSQVRTDAYALSLFTMTALLVWTGPHRWFFVSLAAATLVAVFAPMRPYYHCWQQVTPALALMIPAAIAGSVRPHRIAVVAVAASGYLALNALFTVAYLGLVRSCVSEYEVPRRQLDEVVMAVREAARPGDSLLAVGRQSPYVAFASGLPPATPFFWQGYWDSLIPLSGTTVEASGADLRGHPPDIMALQMDAPMVTGPRKWKRVSSGQSSARGLTTVAMTRSPPRAATGSSGAAEAPRRSRPPRKANSANEETI